MEGNHATYWNTFSSTVRSLLDGLKITFRHLLNARRSQHPVIISSQAYFDQPAGIATIQYPYEMQPVPDTGRYRLHNEIDDCIVCDKCAKICPVNCIAIEPIKSPVEIGKTSDGTPKRIYAATFDIDMGKCCFCALCTTVCPTECLTMTKVYDFSVFDIREHNFEFAEMSEAEISDKRKAWDDHQQTKNNLSAQGDVSDDKKVQGPPTSSKPVFKPRIKPAGPPPDPS